MAQDYHVIGHDGQQLPLGPLRAALLHRENDITGFSLRHKGCAICNVSMFQFYAIC